MRATRRGVVRWRSATMGLVLVVSVFAPACGSDDDDAAAPAEEPAEVRDPSESESESESESGSESAVALEFVRRALAGDPLDDLIATEVFLDSDHEVGPFDAAQLRTDAAALTQHADPDRALTAGPTPEATQGDAYEPGCGLTGDVTRECNVDYVVEGSPTVRFVVAFGGPGPGVTGVHTIS